MVLIKYRFDSDKGIDSGLTPEYHHSNPSPSQSPPSSTARSPSASDVETFNKEHSGQIFIHTSNGVKINQNLSPKSQEEAKKIANRVGWKVVSGGPARQNTTNKPQTSSQSTSGQINYFYNPETGVVSSSSDYNIEHAKPTNITHNMTNQIEAMNRESIIASGGYLTANITSGKVYSSPNGKSANNKQVGIVTPKMKQEFLQQRQTGNPPPIVWGRDKNQKNNSFSFEAFKSQERGKKWYKTVSDIPLIGGALAENELQIQVGAGRIAKSVIEGNTSLYDVSQGALEMGGGSLNIFSAGYLIGSGGVAIGNAGGAYSAVSGSSLSAWQKARIISSPVLTFSEGLIGNAGKFFAIDIGSQVMGEGINAFTNKRGFNIENVKINISKKSIGNMLLASGGSQVVSSKFLPFASSIGTVKGSALLGSIGASTFTLAYETASDRTKNLPEKTASGVIIGGILGGASGYVESKGYRLAVGFKKEDIVVSKGKDTLVAGDVPYGFKLGVERISKDGLKFYGGSVGKPDSDLFIAPKGVVESIDIATSPESKNLIRGASYTYKEGKVNEVMLEQNVRKVAHTQTKDLASNLRRYNGKLIGSTVEKAITTSKGSLSNQPSARSLSKSDIDVQFMDASMTNLKDFAKSMGGTLKTGKVGVTYINYPQLADKYTIVTDKGVHIDVSNMRIAPLNTPRMAGPFGEFFTSSTSKNSNLPHVSAQQQVATKSATLVFSGGEPFTLEAGKTKYLSDMKAMRELQSGKRMGGIRTGMSKVLEQTLGSPMLSVSMGNSPSASFSIESPLKISSNTHSRYRSSVSKSLFNSKSKTSSYSLPSLPESSSSTSSSSSSPISSFFSSSSSSPPSSSISIISPSSNPTESVTQFNINIPAPPPIIPYAGVGSGGSAGGRRTSRRAKPSKKLFTLYDSISQTNLRKFKKIKTANIDFRGGFFPTRKKSRKKKRK